MPTNPERVKPIRPKEVAERKIEIMPDAVIESFNELIALGSGNKTITVKVDDVVALMVSKGLNRNEIFKNHWLDIEEIYKKAGWIVKYDGPGFNEDYDAYFTFKDANSEKGPRRGTNNGSGFSFLD